MKNADKQNKRTKAPSSSSNPITERAELALRNLLRKEIKSGKLTLPNGWSVSDLSEHQCLDILRLRSVATPPKFTEVLPLFDPFHSISDPMGYLLILSRELRYWADSLKDYTKDYVGSLNRMYKVECSDRRVIYEETAHHIDEDLIDSSTGLEYFLAAIYGHRRMALSIREVAPLELEGVAILQAVLDKESDAYRNYADALEYYIYPFAFDKEGNFHTTVVFNESRKAEELELEAYEFAFENIEEFSCWIEENRIAYRLEELANRLKVYCQIKAENPEELARMEVDIEDERVATLLGKDIVKAIIKVLGKERKKRVQMVKETQYEDGGYMGSTLHELKRVGILEHTSPYYRVHPAYYKRLGICPDKEGQ